MAFATSQWQALAKSRLDWWDLETSVGQAPLCIPVSFSMVAG